MPFLMNIFSILLLSLEIIIIVATIIITVTIIINVNKEEEVTITAAEAIITRITATITIIITVIKTVSQESVEDQIIGVVVEVQEHLIAPKEQIRVLVDHHQYKLLQQCHKKFKMNPSIHAGKNHHHSTMIVSEDQIITVEEADLVENGINVVQRLITLYRYHVMNVLNRSCLVLRIRVSILANTKTFPWRRRDSKFLNTLRLLMISS